MKIYSQFTFTTAIFAAFSLFIACGDDVTEVTEVNEIHQDGMAVLDAGLELSKQKCDTTNVGDMLFVMDSSEVFVCNGKGWVSLKGADGKEGTGGKDGEGCTAKPVKNAAGLKGLEVTCGKTVIDTVWNGKDGNVGETGAGCTLEDDGNGSVTVTCGEGDGATTAILYKAMCGTKPYDPAKSFCSEGELYSCNDKPYDPKKQYCKLGTTVENYGWLTDTRDYHVYKMVEICDESKSSCQTWMAENLNYEYNHGTAKSYCYNDKADLCSKHGRLYTWAAAIDSVALANDAGNPQTCGYGKTCTLPSTVQGICPEGWHLPSRSEWQTLFTNVGGADIAGVELKSTRGWNSGGNGDDAYGFAVLPAGYRGYGGSFGFAGYYAIFWSSTEGDSDYAYREYFSYDHSSVGEDSYGNKDYAFSVRCLHSSN